MKTKLNPNLSVNRYMKELKTCYNRTILLWLNHSTVMYRMATRNVSRE